MRRTWAPSLSRSAGEGLNQAESIVLPVESDPRTDDLVQPFRIDPFALRGRLVRLGPTVDRILSQHDYPEPVAAVLGEAIALAVVLAGALKYDGIFTLQTKSDGPIRLIVADVSTEGAVRGYAQYDAARLGEGELRPGQSPSVPELIGSGYIAFTVDQGEDTERYQGIAARPWPNAPSITFANPSRSRPGSNCRRRDPVRAGRGAPAG